MVRRWLDTDAARRAARTFIQAAIAMLTLLLVPWLQQVLDWANGAGEFPAWSALGRIGVAAVASGAIAVVTWVQNVLEDRGTIPAVGKGDVWTARPSDDS